VTAIKAFAERFAYRFANKRILFILFIFLALIITLGVVFSLRGRGRAVATSPSLPSLTSTATATPESVAVVAVPRKTQSVKKTSRPKLTATAMMSLPYPAPEDEIEPAETEPALTEPVSTTVPLSEDEKAEYIDFIQSIRNAMSPLDFTGGEPAYHIEAYSTGRFEVREVELPSGEKLPLDIMWVWYLNGDGDDLIEVPFVIGYPLEDGKYYFAAEVPPSWFEVSIEREERLERAKRDLSKGELVILFSYIGAAKRTGGFDWGSCASWMADPFYEFPYSRPCELAAWMDSEYPGVLLDLAEWKLDTVPEEWLLIGFNYTM